MRQRPLAALWKSFHREVFPDASPTDRREVRWTFYCGAQAVLETLIRQFETPDRTNDVQVFDALIREVGEFNEEVKQRTRRV